MDYFYQSENLNYTTHGTLRLHTSIAFFNFNGPYILFFVKDSWMDCFIDLSVLTTDIARLLSFLFSLCNDTTTVKAVLSQVKLSRWSPFFLVRNFCATRRYSRCSYVVLSATNVNTCIPGPKLSVLKKIQTYLKQFKQLQFPNYLFNDPNFASNIHFFGFTGLEIINLGLSAPCSTSCNSILTRFGIRIFFG